MGCLAPIIKIVGGAASREMRPRAPPVDTKCLHLTARKMKSPFATYHKYCTLKIFQLPTAFFIAQKIISAYRIKVH